MRSSTRPGSPPCGLLQAVLSRRPVVSGFDDPDYELETMPLKESLTAYLHRLYDALSEASGPGSR